jgi:Domain of Unknown Function with PDB structure (DUF3857)
LLRLNQLTKMKHFLVTFAAVLLITTLLHAQKIKLPSVGKIERADLEMTDCDYDKGAAAYKLIDRGNVYYDRGVDLFKMVVERRTRIKILKEKGMEYANVKIPYYSRNNDQKMVNIDAYTYNLDAAGNVVTTKVEKSSIYTQKLSRDYTQITIAFPQVKVGSVIEYKYRLDRESIGYIEDWYFQDEIPVRFSEFEMKVPLNFKFNEDPFIYMKVDKKQDENEDLISGNNGVYRVKTLYKTYTMQNLPGIHDEPYMTCKEDYLQRIGFQLAQIDYGEGNIKDYRTTWLDVVKGLNEDDDFGQELRKGLNAAETILAATTQCKDTLCRMATIFNTVKTSMNWNGNNSIYAMQGINTAWDKKTGTTGDINIILYTLLKKAGITAFPLLTSTRDHGVINLFFPSERQFDALMVYAEVSGKAYILNAADRYNPYRLVPYNVINTRAFLVDGEQSEWITIVSPDQKRQMTAIQADIDANGVMKGEAMVNSYDYAKNTRYKSWLQDKSGFKDNYFGKAFTAMKVDSLEVSYADNDAEPMEQKVKFSSKLNSSGGYSYFNINLFSGLETNPFTDDDRTTDVDFGYMQDYSIYGSFIIPDGYSFDELPKNMTMIMPDTSIIFTRHLQAEDNTLNTRVSIQFKKTFYSAQYYPEFQEFYKKMLAKLNEQIVIKKK